MNWNSPEVVSVAPQRSRIDPEEVRRLYWDEGLSIQTIAERFKMGCSSVRRIMCQYNIPRRSRIEGTTLVRYRILMQKLGPEELLLVSIGKNKTYKFCPRCSKVKPVDEFWRDVAHNDGLTIYCIKCVQEFRLEANRKARLEQIILDPVTKTFTLTQNLAEGLLTRDLVSQEVNNDNNG